MPSLNGSYYMEHGAYLARREGRQGERGRGRGRGRGRERAREREREREKKKKKKKERERDQNAPKERRRRRVGKLSGVFGESFFSAPLRFALKTSEAVELIENMLLSIFAFWTTISLHDAFSLLL